MVFGNASFWNKSRSCHGEFQVSAPLLCFVSTLECPWRRLSVVFGSGGIRGIFQRFSFSGTHPTVLDQQLTGVWILNSVRKKVAKLQKCCFWKIKQKNQNKVVVLSRLVCLSLICLASPPVCPCIGFSQCALSLLPYLTLPFFTPLHLTLFPLLLSFSTLVNFLPFLSCCYFCDTDVILKSQSDTIVAVVLMLYLNQTRRWLSLSHMQDSANMWPCHYFYPLPVTDKAEARVGLSTPDNAVKTHALTCTHFFSGT